MRCISLYLLNRLCIAKNIQGIQKHDTKGKVPPPSCVCVFIPAILYIQNNNIEKKRKEGKSSRYTNLKLELRPHTEECTEYYPCIYFDIINGLKKKQNYEKLHSYIIQELNKL